MGVRFEGGKEIFRFNNKTRDNNSRVRIRLKGKHVCFYSAKEDDTLRNRIVAGYKAIHNQESKLSESFLNRASKIPGLKIYGNS